jgi:two-component system alkaline phosphatase synthesis response regulator PhoP
MELIYLLEDDDSIRELVAYTLNAQGMEARGFARPSEFRDAMKEALPSLVLLDIMLPEEDGLTILKKLRKNPATARLPVIMLTAKSTEYDKVLGLDGGADDYVAKPFGMMELLSRIRALLRRTETSSDEQLQWGSLCVTPSRHTVLVDGEEVTLTQKEFELLCVLLRSPGAVFSREQLMNQVWGYTFAGETRTVDVHVRTLRQKLGSAGNCIQTVRGYGYKIDD